VVVDSTGPSVESVVPEEDAPGVLPGANVEVTFSEQVSEANLDRPITLTKTGETMPVAAGVSYDAATRKVTLDPVQDLSYGASYTATIEGGPDGVKDLAGNPLEAEKTWSFDTAQVPDRVAPNTAITAGSSGFVRSTTAAFGWSAEDNATPASKLLYSYRLDGGAWTGYSPRPTARLAGLSRATTSCR
jgi:hypothetical protein